MNADAQATNKAKLWQIGGFALNNTATNCYLFFMNYIAYYMGGYVGVGVALASVFLTAMRITDAITDPFIGYLIDKTTTKWGKNRPFMLVGNVMLMVGSGLMVLLTHYLPEKVRFPLFAFFYVFYVIGYTFQNLVTKSGQTCLTNDPKQRPLFSLFDGIFKTVLYIFIAKLFSGKLVPKYGGFTAEVFRDAWMIIAPVSLICTIIPIISISSKDRPEYYGLGIPQKIQFKDYWDVLKNNRAIQMLVVAASTDKLATQTRTNSTIAVIIYGIVCGNFALHGAMSGYTSIPSLIFLILGVGFVATRLGQKKAMMVGTYGALACCVCSVLLFYLGDPTTMALPGVEGFNGWTFFTVAYIVLSVGYAGFSNISGSIVIPMVADCSDYEVYRSGRYVPGIISTLFSFVDKFVSSLTTTIVGLMCAAIGFKDVLPSVDTPYSSKLMFIGIFGMFGLTIIGLICNVIAMKFYPLSGEKMKEIQSEIAIIKAKAQMEQNA